MVAAAAIRSPRRTVGRNEVGDTRREAAPLVHTSHRSRSRCWFLVVAWSGDLREPLRLLDVRAKRGARDCPGSAAGIEARPLPGPPRSGRPAEGHAAARRAAHHPPSGTAGVGWTDGDEDFMYAIAWTVIEAAGRCEHARRVCRSASSTEGRLSPPAKQRQYNGLGGAGPLGLGQSREGSRPPG